jgi:SAM-dependent methyltransferase
VQALEKQCGPYRQQRVERGARMIGMFQRRLARHYALPGHERALDIGCGTGAATLALHSTFGTVVGVDWSLAALLLFRKSLLEQGISNVVLAQADFLQLPLVSEAFDYVTALNVIEHMITVERGLAEAARVLRSGGCFCGDCRNRFDLFFPEPHTQLRWLGCLPRRWAIRYAQWRRNFDYTGTRLLSYWELRRALASCFGAYQVMYPDVSAYGGSKHIETWLSLFEAQAALVARWALPFFPTFVAIGQKAK